MAGEGFVPRFKSIVAAWGLSRLRRVGEFPDKLCVCCVKGNNLTAQLIFTEAWQKFFLLFKGWKSSTSTMTERANDVTCPPADHSSKHSHQRYPLQNKLHALLKQVRRGQVFG